MTAVNGVRSSCEMLARNSSLTFRASTSAAYWRSSSSLASVSATFARRISSVSTAFSAVAAIWSATMRSRLRASTLRAPGSA